jgi:AraC-like DNA-binding protein
MPTTHRRLAVAGILTAAAIAVPAAALAAGSDSPHPKPQHPVGASGSSEPAPDMTALAKSAGISVSRLEAGLRAAKPAGGNTTAGIAAFAAAAGVSNATAHRIVETVFGANSPGPTPKPGSSAGPSGKSEAVAPDLSRLASSAGISVSRLQAGLIAAKKAGGNHAAGVAAFAAAAGVSNATAHRIVDSVFGANGNPSVTGAAAAAVLASHLGVSKAMAQRALQQVAALARENGVDPHSAAFARVAHDLGVSPARLAAGLDAVKQSMAGR